MKRPRSQTSGFALVVTLVLMALVVVVVVAYLGNTRTDRSTSSLYANRLRAKMMADSGLAAATELLYEHTKRGNYITAMPAPELSPSAVASATPIRTEIYRAATGDDPLRIDNAVGDVLASRVDGTASSAPGRDSRPAAVPPVTAGNPATWGIPDPGFSAADSYNFNQITQIGGVDGRLVTALPSPSPAPAFGQWVKVRDSTGKLIGRYAFFIEDESMKVNVDVAGNDAAAGAHLRVNDLAATLPSPRPSNQVQELFSAGVLPTGANRSAAIAELAALGGPSQRLPSAATTGLLNQWATDFSSTANLITTVSKSDLTTSRGWLRMDVNQLVTAASSSTAKADAATAIGNWIGEAWTGPRTLAELRDDSVAVDYGNRYDANDAFAHVYFDERLRRQIGANIVDYIDSDSDPTDAGDVNGYPVIGIEKIPYLTQIDVVYQSSNQTATSATVQIKFLLKFLNMFDVDLPLAATIKKVRIKGVPIVTKNGTNILDKRTTVFEIPVGPTGTNNIDGAVPKGTDGQSNSGAKTFDTGFTSSDAVTFPAEGTSRFAAGMLEVEVLGANDTRIDVIRSSLRDIEARYLNSASDFLPDGRQAASISVHWRDIADDPVSPRPLNDPRYRPSVSHFRWYNLTRTDEDRVNDLKDVAEVRSRSWAVDWNDHTQNRPLAVIANRPLANTGELGNISLTQFPWRTVYLQYPERPPNSTIQTMANEISLMRSRTADYVLLDLFRTTSDTSRAGAFNVNSQAELSALRGAFAAAFGEIQVGSPALSQDTPEILGSTSPAVSALATVVSDRRSASGSPPENSPRRPFFQSAEIATPISREVNLSDGTDTSSDRSRVTSTILTRPRNYRRDVHVEQPFRAVSDAISTRGNVFRVLYVGQAISDQKDAAGNAGQVERDSEITAEYFGEAFVERQPRFDPDPLAVPAPSPSVTVKTVDSSYRVLALRPISE